MRKLIFCLSCFYITPTALFAMVVQDPWNLVQNAMTVTQLSNEYVQTYNQAKIMYDKINSVDKWDLNSVTDVAGSFSNSVGKVGGAFNNYELQSAALNTQKLALAGKIANASETYAQGENKQSVFNSNWDGTLPQNDVNKYLNEWDDIKAKERKLMNEYKKNSTKEKNDVTRELNQQIENLSKDASDSNKASANMMYQANLNDVNNKVQSNNKQIEEKEHMYNYEKNYNDTLRYHQKMVDKINTLYQGE